MPPKHKPAFKLNDVVTFKKEAKILADWRCLRGKPGTVVEICTAYRALPNGSCARTDQPNGYIEVLFTDNGGNTRRVHTEAEDFELHK